MQRRKFRYLPHTADVAFAAYGGNLREAIENSAEALLNIMLDLKKITKLKSGNKSIRIKESASTLENLVWYTLQDILTRVDEKKLLAYSFNIQKLTTGKKFAISGELVYKNIEKDLFLLEVKAVTPHDLTVNKGKNGYEIRILVDV